MDTDKGKFGSVFWNEFFEKVRVSKSAVWNWVFFFFYICAFWKSEWLTSTYKNSGLNYKLQKKTMYR